MSRILFRKSRIAVFATALLWIGVAPARAQYVAYVANTNDNSVSVRGVAAGNYARLDVGNTFSGDQRISGNILAQGSLTIGSGTPIRQYISATYNITVPTLMPTLKPNTCTSLPESLAGASSAVNLSVPNSFMSVGGFLMFQACESTFNTITIRVCDVNPNGPAGGAVTDTVRVALFKQ